MRWLVGVVAIAGMLSSGLGSQTYARERHVVVVDQHPVVVWSRQPPNPRAAVLLVHGRTWSSLPDFDLQVPGLQRSVLASLAARGVAAYAVDLRGYGATPRDASGWLTPARSSADIAEVLDWMTARHPDLPRPVLVGWSRGAAIAMLTVQRTPSSASALVLYGFAFAPGGTFSDGKAAQQSPARVANTAAAARSDFISPRVTAPAVIRAFVEQALRADPVLADVRGDEEFNELDPARIALPVLVVHGARDPAIVPAQIKRLVDGFTHPDSRVVVLPGGDHAAHLEATHDLWIDTIVSLVDQVGGRAG